MALPVPLAVRPSAHLSGPGTSAPAAPPPPRRARPREPTTRPMLRRTARPRAMRRPPSGGFPSSSPRRRSPRTSGCSAGRVPRAGPRSALAPCSARLTRCALDSA